MHGWHHCAYLAIWFVAWFVYFVCRRWVVVLWIPFLFCSYCELDLAFFWWKLSLVTPTGWRPPSQTQPTPCESQGVISSSETRIFRTFLPKTKTAEKPLRLPHKLDFMKCSVERPAVSVTALPSWVPRGPSSVFFLTSAPLAASWWPFFSTVGACFTLNAF